MYSQSVQGNGQASDYAVAVLNDSPDLYMQFLEGELLANSSEVVDALDATSSNNVVEVAGIVDGAGQFNGTDSDIIVPNYTSIQNAGWSGGDISLSAIIRIDSAWTQNFGICAKGPGSLSGSSSGWLFYVIQSTGRLAFWSQGGVAPLRFETTTAVPTDTWVHLSMSVTVGTNGTEKMYFDGVSQATTRLSQHAGSNLTDAAYDFTIGKYRIDAVPTYSGFGEGEIDELALWSDVTISEAQFQAHVAAAGMTP